MLKKSITYRDYNDVERTEDFYFNLTKAELAEMNLTTTGGMQELINKIINTQDTPELIKLFKKIVFSAYGEKSLDGRRFIKKDDNGRLLAEQFAETEAYSELFMELATNDKAASDFINGILPKIEQTPANI